MSSQQVTAGRGSQVTGPASEAGAGPAAEVPQLQLLDMPRVLRVPRVAQVMGQTGAVSPGLCGTARAAAEGEEQVGHGAPWGTALRLRCTERLWSWSGNRPTTTVGPIWSHTGTSGTLSE